MPAHSVQVQDFAANRQCPWYLRRPPFLNFEGSVWRRRSGRSAKPPSTCQTEGPPGPHAKCHASAIGPITVDPSVQGGGVGRQLMQAVIERARGAMGARLVQDAFNTRSYSLYASIGFDLREPLLLMRGTPRRLGNSTRSHDLGGLPCLLTNGTGSRTSKRRERLRPGAQQLVPATASQKSEKQGGTEAQRQRR